MDAAWLNYYKYYKISYEEVIMGKHCPDFWKWIDPESLDYNHEPPGWMLTPEQYHKVSGLAGPYYHALMKAYEVRQEVG